MLSNHASTRALFTILASALALGASACGPKVAPSTATPRATLGTSIASATPLPVGAKVEGTLACGQKAYVGPFEFTKDPETIEIKASIRTVAASGQACGGGHSVDKTGQPVATLGFGCSTGGPHEEVVSLQYSPGNGGSGATPVYFEVMLADAACEEAVVTLTR